MKKIAFFGILCCAVLSLMAQPKSVEALCPTYSFPFFEDFDTYDDYDIVQNCWTHMDQNANYPHMSNEQSLSGDYSMHFNSYMGKNMEAVKIPGSYNMRNVQLNFAAFSPNAHSFIIIGVTTDASNLETYEAVDTVYLQNASRWERFRVAFTYYTGNGKYLTFSCDGLNEIYLDDIKLNTPSCDMELPTYETFESYDLGLNTCWRNVTIPNNQVIDHNPTDTSYYYVTNNVYHYDTTFATVSTNATTFTYTGGAQSCTLTPGTYTVQAWGGQGGDGYYSGSTGDGGKGGYAQGAYTINTTTTVYVYVGGQGTTGNSSGTFSGGYNGGGAGYYYSGGGGGATHVSTRSGLLQNQASYVAQLLLVAGGGGGGHAYGGNSTCYIAAGGYGGGDTGGDGYYNSCYWGYTYYGRGGTQYGPGYNNYSSSSTYCGGFGYGGQYYTSYCSGGGGGYYGGAGGGYNGCSGGGGSGYVSPSLLTNAYTSAGNETFPSTNSSTETGHSGNGYCKISVDSTYIDQIDTILDYSTTDTLLRYNSHSLVIMPGTNPSYVASPKIVTSNLHINSISFDVFSLAEEEVTMGFMTSQNNAASFSSAKVALTQPDSWTHVTCSNLPDEINEKYLAFKSNGANKVYIDNLDFSLSLSINDKEIVPQKLQVIPNPATSYLDLRLDNGTCNFEKVEVYTMFGALVKSYGSVSGRISIADLANGVYILRADDAVAKFIKQ